MEALIPLLTLAVSLGTLAGKAAAAKTEAERQQIMIDAHAEVDAFKERTAGLKGALSAQDAAADQALRDAKQP